MPGKIEYRRSKRGVAWHWVPECSHYPEKPAQTRFHGRGFGRFRGDKCNECKAKSKN